MTLRLTPLLAALAAMAVAASADAADPPAADGQARAVLRSREQATLSSDIAGRILSMPFREGERFTKGDRLVEFDCEALKAAQGIAKAGLNHALARQGGLDQLVAHRAGSGMDLALARAATEKARFELRGASIAVERCVITAPFSGRVVELKAHAHETVAQGAPLMAVLDDTALEVSLVVPSAWLGWLKPGQAFILDIDETRRSHQGRIARFGAQIDPVSQTITVYGDLVDPDRAILPGMSGTARFIPP